MELEAQPKRVKTEGEDDEQASVTVPRVSFHVGGAHVWQVDDILLLRRHRVAGELVGADLGFPAQNITHGPPLTLAPEEVGVRRSMQACDTG